MLTAFGHQFFFPTMCLPIIPRRLSGERPGDGVGGRRLILGENGSSQQKGELTELTERLAGESGSIVTCII